MDLRDQVSQEIRSGVKGLSPSEDAVFDGLAGKSNRYENNQLLLIGDSITAQGYTTSPSARYRNLGWWCWCLSYMNWNLKVSHVGAVSGYTTSQVLADLETQLQTYSPQWTWGVTGQNDLGLDDVAGVLADIDSIVALCKQYGTKLMLGTVTPRTVMTAQMQEDISGINKGLRNLALVGDIILFDSEACILDSTSTTGLANASYLYDTIHPNPTGAWRIGLEAYNKIKYFIPESTQSGGVSSGDDISINAFSKILNKNCKLVGTSGTVSTGTSGDVANNFLLARSSGTGLTAVGSKVLESTYKDVNWQRIVVGGTSAGSDELRFQQSIADSTFLTPIIEGTDKIKGRVSIRLSGLSTNILNVRLTVNTIAASAETGATQCMVDNGFNLVSAPTETMTFETPELTVPVGTDTVRISVFIKYASGAATGTIDLTDVILTVV